MDIKFIRQAYLYGGMVVALFFLSYTALAYAQDVSPDDEIIVKSTQVIMFQVKANIKLTDDQLSTVESIVKDNVVKVRKLQLAQEDGSIDAKTMYDQRQELYKEEDQALSQILTADQMNIWVNIQQGQP